MALTSLDNIDPRIADQALSAALAFVSALPEVETAPETVAARDAIIAEARRKLHLASDDQRDAALARIGALLDKEVERRLQEGADLKAAEDRLGEQGRLPNGAYQINTVLDTEYGVKESGRFAKKLVERAELTEHIYAGEDSRRQNSLFARQVTDTRRREPYWAVAIAHRVGSVLTVTDTYRLFPETVAPPARPVSVFDVLSAFLQTYGLPTRVNGTEVPARLFFDAPFGAPDKKSGVPFLETYDAPPSTRIVTTGVLAGLPDQVRWAFGFSIMPDVYARDWVRLMKGVKI